MSVQDAGVLLSVRNNRQNDQTKWQTSSYEGQVFYKVKWKGYSYGECTWQPLSNLKTVLYMVEEFDQNNQPVAKNSKNMPQFRARPTENNRNKQSSQKSTSSKDKRKQPKLQGESQETRKVFRKNEKQKKDKDVIETSEHENYHIEKGKDMQYIDDFGAHVNIGVLQQRLNQLVRQKQEDNAEAKIVSMYRGDNLDQKKEKQYNLSYLFMFQTCLLCSR